MNNRIDWEILIRHLEGTSSHREEKRLQEWLDTGPENRKTLDMMTKIWNSPDNLLPDPDIESAWQQVQSRIALREISDSSLKKYPTEFYPFLILSPLLTSRIFRYAAVLLIVILIPILISRLKKSEKWTEVSVPLAGREIVTLPDDSRVTLDAGSRLRYAESFSDRERQVFLNGEGYFEVSTRTDQPFTVQASQALITVMGTRFNVRAWPSGQQNRVAVTVSEGTVSFSPEQTEHDDQKVIISPGQYSELIGNGNPSPPRQTDINRHLSWLQHEMHFQNVPLMEVLDQLERWYDVEITVSSPSLATSRVTIFIGDKSLRENLELISLMNDVRFHQEGRKIMISNNH